MDTAVVGIEDAEEEFGFLPEQFTESMRIDSEALDQECLKQTVLAPQYGFLLAQLTSDRDHLKRRVKVVRAETERAVRSDPESYGLSKATEAAVTAVLETHPDVDAAEKDLIAKQYEVNMAAVAVDAVASRKKLLENLIQLWMGSYFSTPKGDMEKMATKSVEESHRAHLGKKMEARKAAPPVVREDCDSSDQGVDDGPETVDTTFEDGSSVSRPAAPRTTLRRPLPSTKKGGE